MRFLGDCYSRIKACSRRVFAPTCGRDASQRMPSMRDSSRGARDVQLSSPQKSCLIDFEERRQTRVTANGKALV